MNNHNDFGLKKVDLNKRKLKKKSNFFIPLFLVISLLTIVLLNNYQDLSFNKNIDNKSSKEFISSESPFVSDIVETDSLNNYDSYFSDMAFLLLEEGYVWETYDLINEFYKLTGIPKNSGSICTPKNSFSNVVLPGITLAPSLKK